jgi:hypothetical protein
MARLILFWLFSRRWPLPLAAAVMTWRALTAPPPPACPP